MPTTGTVQESSVRHSSALGSWELVRRAPDRRLRGSVIEYSGYAENAPTFVRRREMPSGAIPLIINFGPPFRLFDRHDRATWCDHSSFVAGLHETYALVGTTGAAFCMQVDFTPLGARRFFRMSMQELTNRVIDLDLALGPTARRLEDSLREAPDWAARFDILDRVLLTALAGAREPSPAIAWAWRRLEETGGRIGVGELAGDIGWSRKHFAFRFRQEVGLPPKLFGRVLRFGRAVVMLQGAARVDWAALAQTCGYFDQSHLIRDFRSFSGESPGAFLGRVLPDGTGVMDGAEVAVTFVQDAGRAVPVA